jgi:uncharacterized protein
MGVYFATKAFVLSFTEALHEEVRGTGVHVTALCPGPVQTEFGELAGFEPTVAKAFDRVAMLPGPVVAAGLAALAANQAVTVPGLLNKVGAQSQRLLPRAAVRSLFGLLK